MSQPLNEDVLYGAQAIAEFVFGASDRATMRRVYYMTANGHIPVKKIGKIVVGRKSVIDAALMPD